MAKYRVTWKHKDLGDVELVDIQEIKADNAQDAFTTLSQIKHQHMKIIRIEKLA